MKFEEVANIIEDEELKNEIKNLKDEAKKKIKEHKQEIKYKKLEKKYDIKQTKKYYKEKKRYGFPDIPEEIKKETNFILEQLNKIARKEHFKERFKLKKIRYEPGDKLEKDFTSEPDFSATFTPETYFSHNNLFNIIRSKDFIEDIKKNCKYFLDIDSDFTIFYFKIPEGLKKLYQTEFIRTKHGEKHKYEE